MSSKSQLDAYISIRFIVGILEFNVTRVLSFSKPSFDTCLFDSIVCLADISKKKKKLQHCTYISIYNQYWCIHTETYKRGARN